MPARQRLQAFAQRYNDFVWPSETADASQPRSRSARALVRAARIVHAVANDLADGQLSLWAMSLVYTTVLSLVPLLAAAFAVLKGFGVHNDFKPVLLAALEPIGSERFELAERIVGFVDRIQVGVLGAIGLAFLLYSVFAMVHKVEKSFNYTWRLTKTRSIARRFSDYLSVLMIGPLLIFLSVGAATSFHSEVITEINGADDWLSPIVQTLSWTLPWLLMCAGFTFVYVFVPNTKVEFRSALVGGASTAVVWKLMGWIFSLVVADSANTTAVYSAFASAIVLLIWIYLGWYVLLTGASVAYYHQHSRNTVVPRRDTQYSQHEREAITVATMLEVARSFAGQGPACTVDTLALQLNVAIDHVQSLVDALIDGRWLVRSREPEACLHPARPLDKIEIAELLSFVRDYAGQNIHPRPQLHRDATRPKWAQLLELAQDAQRQALAGQTMQTLLEHSERDVDRTTKSASDSASQPEP